MRCSHYKQVNDRVGLACVRACSGAAVPLARHSRRTARYQPVTVRASGLAVDSSERFFVEVGQDDSKHFGKSNKFMYSGSIVMDSVEYQ